jgi:hypothetical protein
VSQGDRSKEAIGDLGDIWGVEDNLDFNDKGDLEDLAAGTGILICLGRVLREDRLRATGMDKWFTEAMGFKTQWRSSKYRMSSDDVLRIPLNKQSKKSKRQADADNDIVVEFALVHRGSATYLSFDDWRRLVSDPRAPLP